MSSYSTRVPAGTRYQVPYHIHRARILLTYESHPRYERPKMANFLLCLIMTKQYGTPGTIIPAGGSIILNCTLE